MKRLLFIIPTFLVLFVALGFFWWNNLLLPTGNDGQDQRFVITRGSSIETIGGNLEKSGIIKSSLAFKLYVRLNNLDNKIPSGEFAISGNLSLPKVLEVLQKGPIEIWVTVPEGLRREEVAIKFADGLNLSGQPREVFLEEFLASSKNLEGYLFPDTYLVPKDVTAKKVVDLLESTFSRKFIYSESALARAGLSLSEVVILASIIERETLTKGERPVVAGVYLKRIDAGWPLQADAAVQYAVANINCRNMIECEWWPRPLTSSDLATNSPFNTYKFPGLPPGPIANPGLTSLEAVTNFEESPYWYYIHDSSGTIHYAETLEEHNANVARYLR